MKISFRQNIRFYPLIMLLLLRSAFSIQISDLRIENEKDLRQCTEYAPIFCWQVLNATENTNVLMQLYLSNNRSDSLIWSSDTLPYFGNRFRFRSLGTLSAGNTYRFKLQIFQDDLSATASKSLTFRMNSTPGPPRIDDNKISVFTDRNLQIPVTPSHDSEMPDQELKYQIRIFQDDNIRNIVTDSIISATTIRQDTLFLKLDDGLTDNQQYLLCLRAWDGVEYSGWSDTARFSINFVNDKPEPFHLISPLRNDTLKGSPQLRWQASNDRDVRTGADSITYRIELSIDPEFNYFVRAISTSNLKITPPIDLLQNHKQYHWRVFATDTKGEQTKSIENGSFTLNTGNQIPAIPRIIAPQNKQILTPNQYILWQFDDDPDGDRLSFTLTVLDHTTKNVVYVECITDSMMRESRFGLSEDFSIGYNNLVQMQLRHIDLSRLIDGHCYEIQLAVNDNWGGYVSTAWEDASFQYDDNINTPPVAPAGGFSPKDEIIHTIRPVLSWNPGTDKDVQDRLKYRIEISRDSIFRETRFISQQSRYDVNRVRLRTNLTENSVYFWRVCSIDLEEARSPWSITNKFTVNQYNESPEGVSELYTPKDLSEIDTTALFAWRPVSDPDPGDSVHYLILIDNNSDFNSPEIQQNLFSTKHASSGSKKDTLTFPVNLITDKQTLTDNKLYFWKIIAVDESNIKSPLTTFSRFIYNPVNNPPEQVAGGFSPSGSIIVNSRRPILRWNPAEDPDFSDLQNTLSYIIQLSTNPLFPEDQTQIFLTNPGETALTIAASLEENKKYFYRVQTSDPHGAKSQWSSLNSFITNEIPEAPEMVTAEFNPKDSLIVRRTDPIISWLPVNDPDPGQYMRDICYNIRYFLTEKPKKCSYAKSDKGVASVQLFSLKEDQYYGYQVAAIGPDGLTSEWSKINYFGINAVDDPPSDFSLLSPHFYEDSVLTNMEFQWSVSSDKDLGGSLQYILYYSSDSTFTTNVFNATLSTNDSVLLSYRPLLPLERKTKYFWKVVAIDNSGNLTWASNSNDRPFVFTTIGYNRYSDNNIPREYSLFQNYPNPFNRQTVIRYTVSEVGPVDVVIYDVLGKRIRTLAGGRHPAGVYEVIWDGTDDRGSPVPGGMYICRMTARNFCANKKVLLMK